MKKTWLLGMLCLGLAALLFAPMVKAEEDEGKEEDIALDKVPEAVMKAAKEAGLRCAVVYNDYTKGEDFSGAELVARSLEFLNLDLLEKLCLD